MRCVASESTLGAASVKHSVLPLPGAHVWLMPTVRSSLMACADTASVAAFPAICAAWTAAAPACCAMDSALEDCVAVSSWTVVPLCGSCINDCTGSALAKGVACVSSRRTATVQEEGDRRMGGS